MLSIESAGLFLFTWKLFAFFLSLELCRILRLLNHSQRIMYLL
ncbi:hypothetical protein AKJ16_DCAP16408 [Drosera capensis]